MKVGASVPKTRKDKEDEPMVEIDLHEVSKSQDVQSPMDPGP